MMLMSIFITLGGVVIVVMVVTKVYVVVTSGICKSKADLTGKTALVTGANTGIGYYTALDFARRNAHVLLVCRNQQKGQAAVKAIKESTGNQNVKLYIGDMSLMSSVRELVDTIKKNNNKLDILVNNAGLAGLPFTKTNEDLELIMATNHFGPFLLTNLLLDLVKQSPKSRIVNVSSMANRWSKLDLSNMNTEKHYGSSMQYANSKVCNILFTRELARRLEGTGVTCYSLHPGAVASEIWRNSKGIKGLLIGFVNSLYFKTSEEGAQTTIYCAVSEDLAGVTGKYYVDCREAENESCKDSKDMGLAKKLWELSERVTGLTT